MSRNFDKLRTLLAELFQYDRADLDFGIYRIMNLRRAEISRFLERDLLPQVREAFSGYQSADKAEIKAELDKAVENAKGLGVDPDAVPKVVELRAKYGAGFDLDALEDEIYGDLVTFFRRYYSDGDFISLRRYKAGVYAIPYEGEEVKLHWANADQYYIKSTENFRDYAFTLADGRRVRFKLVEADTERDNVKAAGGKERRFALAESDPVVAADGELTIRFEYRRHAAKQAELNGEAIKRLMEMPEMTAWAPALSVPAPTASNESRTLLEKRLADYTARNTYDYFIHKDLGGFLRRELDFYIKNEVMRLDDIESETAPRVEQYLGKIKAMRRIAHKLIDFLDQIESFQKRLWLKRKFVVETGWCVTLDRVPRALYPEIAANDAQRAEWVRLFAIDEIAGDLGAPGYSDPLTVEFLEANPFLVLDTKYFSSDFRDQLLASIDDIDGSCDGVLVHGENFQALNLLMERYRGEVKCIYIDPPYNTAASEILYKNDYKHSSWLTLIENRLTEAYKLMSSAGIFCAAIDDFEGPYLYTLLEQAFGEENHLATVPIRTKPQGRAMAAGFSPNHDYAIFFGKTPEAEVGRIPRNDNQVARYSESDAEGIYTWANFRGTGANSTRADRPKLFYPLFVSEDRVRVPRLRWDDNSQIWLLDEDAQENEEAVVPLDDAGQERVWTLGNDRAREEVDQLVVKKVGGRFQVYRKYRPNQEGSLPGTWWDDPKYSASENGTKMIQDIFGSTSFSYPKSIHAVVNSLRASGATNESITLDFFAGSGTTGHAIINLNRESAQNSENYGGGERKYILIEMGDHFDTVLKPRIQKVIYSRDWKEGKPVSRQGSSHLFKYIRLESYEDTLANLELRRTEEQSLLLERHDTLREDYTLRYLLDVESRGSASLLNVEKFETPFDYILNVGTGSVGETKPVAVDLVETFNYLIGLRVRSRRVIDGLTVVRGENAEGEKVVVIWRDVRVTGNEELEAFVAGLKGEKFDVVYVNGDHNLGVARRIEEVFRGSL